MTTASPQQEERIAARSVDIYKCLEQPGSDPGSHPLGRAGARPGQPRAVARPLRAHIDNPQLRLLICDNGIPEAAGKIGFGARACAQLESGA